MFVEINNRLHESELIVTIEDAEVFLGAFLKEQSYWEYRLKKYLLKIGGKPTSKQLNKLTDIENKLGYSAGVAKKIKKLLEAEELRQRI